MNPVDYLQSTESLRFRFRLWKAFKEKDELYQKITTPELKPSAKDLMVWSSKDERIEEIKQSWLSTFQPGIRLLVSSTINSLNSISDFKKLDIHDNSLF
jgi:hypothetical protein